jgi:TatD DNase family protein
MASAQAVKSMEKGLITMQKVELADAHCHLDLISDKSLIREAISFGVLTIITNGVNRYTSKLALELSDGRNIFPAMGIDPEHALSIEAHDLDTEISLLGAQVKFNKGRVVAIGEIGLDYMKAKTPVQVKRQKRVFAEMLNLAKETNLPVSVHSRNAMDDVLAMLDDHSMKKVHLHFFEGNLQQAKDAERRGYMISIPPADSSTRRTVIKDVAIDSLMAESDSPVVGATPKAVEGSVRMIAETKGITFENAADVLRMNTKRFFGIHAKSGIMRS